MAVHMAALAVIVLIALFGGAIASRIVGHDGARPFPYATNPALKPVGSWTHIPATAQVELDQYGNGRDELIRVLDAGRTSLEIGLGGVLFALLIAIPVGAVAGYFGGFVDAVVSRFTETVMAFPLLLFLVFTTAKLSPSLRGVAYSWVLPARDRAEPRTEPCRRRDLGDERSGIIKARPTAYHRPSMNLSRSS
jgi:ABC-type dipeptide/oligopeptide/nickel transport system permease subunit